MKKALITQSNYIPWKGYFDAINTVDVFVIYDEVQYTKNDWRNRNLIKTADGLHWLTIPVRQETLEQKIFETRIFSDNWSKKHLKTLHVNYSKAKYFENFKEDLFKLYENPSSHLSEVNLSFIKAICALLNIKTQIIDSRELQLKGDRNERLIDACKKLNADVYLSGPAAKNYLNTSLFNQEGINVEWMDYSGYPEYNQLFGTFAHGISIIDLLFNEGKNARNYMKSFNK